LIYPLALVLAVASLGCSQQGLLSEKYARETYEIPRLLDETVELDTNPTAIIYGDNRPGWRGLEKFAKKKAWATWKQLYLPVLYQAWWLGNGIVGGVNHLRNHPDYGNADAERVRDAVLTAALEHDADFVMNTGDMVTDGRRPDHWMKFLRQNRDSVPLANTFPFLPVIGNHDRTTNTEYGMPNYEAVFGYPPFYTVKWRNVDFFVLDSNILVDQYQYISDDTQEELFRKWFVSGPDHEPSWLERELSASNKEFKVVVLHHPPFAFAKHHDNWTKPENGPNLPQKRQLLLRLFQLYGVQLVFSGHQHMYEHNLLNFENTFGQEALVHFVVTGGGGAPLHDAYKNDEIAECRANYAGEGLDATCVIQEVAYNYCVVKTMADQMTVEVFQVSDSPLTDGRLLDRIVVDKRP
jgi:hypothetical protein